MIFKAKGQKLIVIRQEDPVPNHKRMPIVDIGAIHKQRWQAKKVMVFS